jgi:hypothetical protein
MLDAGIHKYVQNTTHPKRDCMYLHVASMRADLITILYRAEIEFLCSACKQASKQARTVHILCPKRMHAYTQKKVLGKSLLRSILNSYKPTDKVTTNFKRTCTLQYNARVKGFK